MGAPDPLRRLRPLSHRQRNSLPGQHAVQLPWPPAACHNPGGLLCCACEGCSGSLQRITIQAGCCNAPEAATLAQCSFRSQVGSCAVPEGAAEGPNRQFPIWLGCCAVPEGPLHKEPLQAFWVPQGAAALCLGSCPGSLQLVRVHGGHLCCFLVVNDCESSSVDDRGLSSIGYDCW